MQGQQDISTEKETIFITQKRRKMCCWTNDQDLKLLECEELIEKRNWKEIGRILGKYPYQCSSRYSRIAPNIQKGRWSTAEDQKLLEEFNNHGPQWSKIGRLMGSRSGKQVRDRYINVLNPFLPIKTFTDCEDKSIVLEYLKYGANWALISKHFANKTSEMIKSRFHSSIKKRISVILREEVSHLNCSCPIEFKEEKQGQILENNSNTAIQLVELYDKSGEGKPIEDNKSLSFSSCKLYQNFPILNKSQCEEKKNLFDSWKREELLISMKKNAEYIKHYIDFASSIVNKGSGSVVELIKLFKDRGTMQS